MHGVVCGGHEALEVVDIYMVGISWRTALRPVEIDLREHVPPSRRPSHRFSDDGKLLHCLAERGTALGSYGRAALLPRAMTRVAPSQNGG